MKPTHQKIVLAIFAVFAAAVLGFKLTNLFVGAPFVTIDDQTMYEGGFLVWFGQVPPQRMYLESWVSGVISLATYVIDQLRTHNAGSIGINLVADAYRAYFTSPDIYVRSYRVFILAVDLITVGMVFCLANIVFAQIPQRRLMAVAVALFYMMSFNTLWSDVVARPDTLTAFFATCGLFLYFKSEIGRRRGLLLCSAVAFGLGAGMKLHAVFFTVFVVLDLLRQHGLRRALPKAFQFAAVSFVVFCVAAGSPLFDPLLYVKLRYLNAVDDASPWIHWGDQFEVVLFGAGWLGVPLFLYGLIHAWRSGEWRHNKSVSSVLFLGVLWLLLFCSIRQMRSYWMLPALSLIYMGAIYGINSLGRGWFKVVAAATMLSVMLVQCFNQMQALRSTPYEELRTWIKQNIAADEPFYVLGFVDFGLPRSTAAIVGLRDGIQEKSSDAVAAGESFTERHARLWEERARVTLLDMLQFQSVGGFTYYTSSETPLSEYREIIDIEHMRYIIMQEHFAFDEVPEMRAELAENYEPITTRIGPGGHSNGLVYTIYRRK